jgi:DNA-binding transcriptional LysR family regulator
VEELTLELIGEYPIITYQEGFTGRTLIDKAFADAGVVPDIVLSAIDADVIKTYVELDLGVGIVASMAYDGFKDRNLALIPVPHLFPKARPAWRCAAASICAAMPWRSSKRSAQIGEENLKSRRLERWTGRPFPPLAGLAVRWKA